MDMNLRLFKMHNTTIVYSHVHSESMRINVFKKFMKISLLLLNEVQTIVNVLDFLFYKSLNC